MLAEKWHEQINVCDNVQRTAASRYIFMPWQNAY